ncbi:NACHT domain-containing protein [Burkholderia thailandensis]|uniref:NACHT domain-containing protein n=1 Tax=Burkholderia thailandensis TaxID=57975 RepID=UPI0022AC369C|nr:hypothetical protein [Burkholderia thailandensis]MCZ2903314.1 hypothetical protein [Burkholderia thailandensis]MDD1484591.1 hypothetical protein [Burkholderia thailandensis]MDD1490305.1 hypothetical protein [Burkholderia thailandensis]MDD1496523.1 hypothetical protein [Burkholderia thailandensis]
MNIASSEGGRYWAPRGQPISTDGDGYTLFVGGKWREYHNARVKQTHELSDSSEVIILLGEPGSGKSFELDILRTRAQASASRQVLSLDLGKYADAGRLDAALRRLLKDCISEEVPSILFLDALDESRVNIKCAETILEDVLRDVSPHSLQLVVTCRTPAWPTSLEEFLCAHWGAPEEVSVSVFEIAPHSRQQVSARLHEEGMDEDGFFTALDHSGAHGLALQPLGLRFLMSQFEEGSAFASGRWELYERGCAALLKESSKRRVEGRSLSLPNVQSRMQVAGLLATHALLTNHADIVLDSTGDFAPEGALYLDVARLLELPLTSGRGDWFASTEQYAETLQSGVFAVKEDGAFVFAHRTYAEFLAAHFVSSLGIPAKRIMGVLSLANGSGQLVPQLTELSAWLGHANPEVLALVLRAEPAMVFDSSVSLADEKDIAAVFDQLVTLVEGHKFPIYDRRLVRSYGKLRHSGLREKLQSVLVDRSRVSALRQFAADVAHVCGLVDDIPELLSIALDASENYEVRQSAASAVHDGGSKASKLALLPLMAGDHQEDPDDELKGIALLSALEADVPVRDVIGYLTKERRLNFTGMYALALRRLENADLQLLDVEPLLSWLAPQLRKERLNAAWDDFVVHMFSKAAFAVMSFDEEWDAFGKVAWLAISNNHVLSTSRDKRGFDTSLELETHPERRLRVLDSILNAADGDPRIAAGQLLYGTGLLTNVDGRYLMDAYQREVGDGTKKRILANLALWCVFDNDVAREWLLNAAGPNAENRDPVLAEIATEHVDSVLLDSTRADSLRKSLALRLEHSMPPTPNVGKKPSIDLLLAAMTGAENGDTWQWVNILSYLRYDGDFEYYLFPFHEVTKSPLWKKLDTGTQSRLANIALAYLRDTGPAATLASNETNNFEDAGIAALVFLYSTGRGNSDAFGDLVVKWARGLARYLPEEQPRPVVNELLRQAFAHAETSVLPLLSKTCEHYLLGGGLPRLPDFAADFMPEPLLRILETMLPGMQSEQAFLALVSFLIERNSRNALESLLQRIQSTTDLAAPPAVKLMALLAKHAPDELIQHLWLRLRALPEAMILLAAEMQIMVAGQAVPLLRVDAAVTERFFEILEERYPTSTDVKTNGIVTARHHIQDFRTCCIISLRDLADAASIAALERISSRHPYLPWIARMVHEAEQKAARDSWLPYKVSEVATALGILAGRVIRTEAELRNAVLDELHLIATKVSAGSSLPAVHLLWDEASERPKQEPRLCDWLASELRDRLSHKGAVVNREVQVRSHNPKGMGERTDILVEISPPAKRGKSGNTLRLVIEVKGCWNADLLTAPTSQLRDNYMKAYNAAFGVYLVMWFMTDRWTKDDRRKAATRRLVPDETLEACINAIATACSAASVGGASITPFVIDCTY